MGHDCLKTDLKKSKNYPVEATTPLIPLSSLSCKGVAADTTQAMWSGYLCDMYNLLTPAQTRVVTLTFTGFKHWSNISRKQTQMPNIKHLHSSAQINVKVEPSFGENDLIVGKMMFSYPDYS